MKKYTVFFEVFGHKLKHTLYAYSKEHAQELIKDKIYFHKVVEGKGDDKAFENIKEAFRNSGLNL